MIVHFARLRRYSARRRSILSLACRKPVHQPGLKDIRPFVGVGGLLDHHGELVAKIGVLTPELIDERVPVTIGRFPVGVLLRRLGLFRQEDIPEVSVLSTLQRASPEAAPDRVDRETETLGGLTHGEPVAVLSLSCP